MRDDEPMESHINDSSSSKPTSFNSISLDPTSLNPTSSQSTLLNPTSLDPSTELDSACDTSLSWSNLMDYDEMELTSSHPEHLDSSQKISKRTTTIKQYVFKKFSRLTASSILLTNYT